MSQRYEFGEAAGKYTRAPMAYYGPMTDFDEAFGEEFEPGDAVLTIGDADASAYALAGTPEELRKYVADLAALLGMRVVADGLAVNENSCHVCGHIDQMFYQHLTSEHYKATNTTCSTCGANLTDGSGDGVAGHWQGCATQEACEGCGSQLRAGEGDGNTCGPCTSSAEQQVQPGQYHPDPERCRDKCCDDEQEG